MSHHVAVILAVALAGFIAGVIAVSVPAWFARNRIKAAMIRRRRGSKP